MRAIAGLDPSEGPCHDREVQEPSEKVLAFRRRFAGVEEADRGDALRDAPTPELRLLRALRLHDVAIALDIARVRTKLGSVPDEELLAEINRSRLERAPMPVSLRDRWRMIRGDRAR